MSSNRGGGEPGSPQLSLSGCSSLFTISTGSGSLDTASPTVRGPPPPTPVSLGGEADMALQLLGGDDNRKTIRMMKNRESALRSRARKRAYVQELEKEVRRLVDENFKLKKQCKQLKMEVAAVIQPTKSSMRRTSSTQF